MVRNHYKNKDIRKQISGIIREIERRMNENQDTAGR